VWPKGTLCITIAANIANTGVLDFDACFPDSVVGFVPGSSVRTEYIQEWLGFLRPTLEAQAPQAAQKNINLEILRNLRVPVPQVDNQDRFTQHVSSVRTLQRSHRGATVLADQAFQSLLAGVFGEGAAA
jgi:type I restriction enzyme S subunit